MSIRFEQLPNPTKLAIRQRRDDLVSIGLDLSDIHEISNTVDAAITQWWQNQHDDPYPQIFNYGIAWGTYLAKACRLTWFETITEHGRDCVVGNFQKKMLHPPVATVAWYWLEGKTQWMLPLTELIIIEAHTISENLDS